MKLVDENMGIGGEYLKGWVVTTIHGQIWRNRRDLGRDLVGEREEPPGSALFLREGNREMSALGRGRAGAGGTHKWMCGALPIGAKPHCVAPMRTTPQVLPRRLVNGAQH
jgi:hypothetical protein